MKKILDIVAGYRIDLLNYGIDLNKHSIKRLWTIYDEDELKRWRNNSLLDSSDVDNIELKHFEGVFLEEAIHDWMIDKGLLNYYSRVVPQMQRTKIIIEYVEIN